MPTKTCTLISIILIIVLNSGHLIAADKSAGQQLTVPLSDQIISLLYSLQEKVIRNIIMWA